MNREVPNLMPTPTVMHVVLTDVTSTGTGTLSYKEDNVSNNDDNGKLIPFLRTDQYMIVELWRTIHL